MKRRANLLDGEKTRGLISCGNDERRCVKKKNRPTEFSGSRALTSFMNDTRFADFEKTRKSGKRRDGKRLGFSQNAKKMAASSRTCNGPRWSLLWRGCIYAGAVIAKSGVRDSGKKMIEYEVMGEMVNYREKKDEKVVWFVASAKSAVLSSLLH